MGIPATDVYSTADSCQHCSLHMHWTHVYATHMPHQGSAECALAALTLGMYQPVPPPGAHIPLQTYPR
jgi:hypothetical protein